MIKDSINLYNNFKYLNIRCYSCGSIDHVVTKCPNLHVTVDPAEVLKEYLADEKEFRETFPRRPRSRFHASSSVEVLQEAASQIQIGHQTEVHYSINSVDDDLGPIGSYSSIDEVLDRRIYDIQPLDFVEDTTHMKFLDLAGAFRPQSIGTLAQLPNSKKNRQKVGEIETFMKNNYDPYYHNLNLDRVRNFEVYCPNNNIARLMTEFEKVRLEKIVAMRLGIKAAKHISVLLVKTFRMNERKGQVPGTAAPIVKRSSLPKHTLVKKKTLKKESTSISPTRRDSVNSNPADITLYNSTNVVSNARRPSQWKPMGKNVPSPGISPLGSSTMLGVPAKPDSFELVLSKISRGPGGKEHDLSIIRENSVEKFGKGTHSNVSVESPTSLTPFDLKPINVTNGTRKFNNSSIDLLNILPGIKSPEGSTPKSSAYNYQGQESQGTKIHINQMPMENFQSEADRNLSFEYDEENNQAISQGVDFPKLIQRFTDKLGENSKNTLTRQTIRTDRETSNVAEKDEKEKTVSSELKITEGNNRLFNLLLHDRRQSHASEPTNKHRASSEDRGKDINKFMDKHNLPGLLKKMSSIYDDE